MPPNMGGGLNGVNQGALGLGGMGNMANASVAGMGGMNANAMGFNPQHLSQQHLAQLQQMTPQQQIEVRQQMQAKLLVSNCYVFDVFAITDYTPLPFFPSSFNFLSSHR